MLSRMSRQPRGTTRLKDTGGKVVFNFSKNQIVVFEIQWSLQIREGILITKKAKTTLNQIRNSYNFPKMGFEKVPYLPFFKTGQVKDFL